MGVLLIDKYSILHFCVGVLWQTLGWNLLSLFVLHTIFEWIENTEYGMNIINTQMPFWPGGKDHPDSIINRTGDVLISLVGWWVAKAYLIRSEAFVIAILGIFAFWKT